MQGACSGGMFRGGGGMFRGACAGGMCRGHVQGACAWGHVILYEYMQFNFLSPRASACMDDKSS